MSALQAAIPRGVQVVPVKVDLEGMLPGGPGGLEDVLENWDESKGKRPHLLYTITCAPLPSIDPIPTNEMQNRPKPHRWNSLCPTPEGDLRYL
jgi:hypothetical protein